MGYRVSEHAFGGDYSHGRSGAHMLSCRGVCRGGMSGARENEARRTYGNILLYAVLAKEGVAAMGNLVVLR